MNPWTTTYDPPCVQAKLTVSHETKKKFCLKLVKCTYFHSLWNDFDFHKKRQLLKIWNVLSALYSQPILWNSFVYTYLSLPGYYLIYIHEVCKQKTTHKHRDKPLHNKKCLLLFRTTWLRINYVYQEKLKKLTFVVLLFDFIKGWSGRMGFKIISRHIRVSKHPDVASWLRETWF